jgi:hypothetical protein
MLKAMAGQGGGVGGLYFRLYEVAIVMAGALLVWSEPWLVNRAEREGILWWWRVPFGLRGLAYAAGVLVLVAFGGTTQKFIYFDF